MGANGRSDRAVLILNASRGVKIKENRLCVISVNDAPNGIDRIMDSEMMVPPMVLKLDAFLKC